MSSYEIRMYDTPLVRFSWGDGLFSSPIEHVDDQVPIRASPSLQPPEWRLDAIGKHLQKRVRQLMEIENPR